jgi:biopolymer transport protein ExbB
MQMSRTVDGVVKAVSSRAASVLVVIAMLTCSGVTFAQDAAAPAAPNPVAEAAAAPAAEAPAAEAPAPDEHKVKVDNPYGLSALWAQGDFVAKGTLIILVIMSASTWYIMVVKLIEQQKLFGESKNADKSFWAAASVKDGVGTLKKGGPFWYIADRGVSASSHHEGTMVEQIDLSSWITMSVNRAVDAINSNLTGGLAVLATVGSTAPFVGLFGTVWGIYHALTAIGISGQASIDKVAGPVGEALIMTAIGLAVAVPAVLGYNWLVRRNKNAMDKVRSFAADLHSVLLSGARVGDKKEVPIRKAA